MFNSNQFTRYDLIETIYSLFKNSLIQSNTLTPIRLLVEHAALVCILNANIGIELGASLLQKFCMLINEYLNNNSTDEYLLVEKKSLDNLILLICNLYNFKLFSSTLLIDLLNSQLIDKLKENDFKFEKIIDLILIIFRCVGLSLRKDNPLLLKDLIVNLQTKINLIKSTSISESINNRLKFMLESINAIKNNDIRKLDAYDQEPVDLIRKQAKLLLKEDQTNQLNISFKDLISANELGRWWIVGSAWSEQQQEQTKTVDQIGGGGGDGYSEAILKLAKQQHMNTDIRRAIFCSIVSAEDYTDAFMKLIKLSLKKQQEREIIYVIMHCALNENAYNPYYSYLMQKFCQYDRRFKMTLTFHSWDKFKMLNEMNKQQVLNLSCLICHLICSDCITLSILKVYIFIFVSNY
jgi:nucleolar MIF4G domain-containing protein 1